MAAIAAGCDAFTVPPGSAVYNTSGTIFNSATTYQGTFSGAHLTFFMGYCGVMTQAQFTDMVNNGVSVCLFYENYYGPNIISPGPAGSWPGMLAYYTYAQGKYDAQSARAAGGNLINGSWPANRPIYYTVDAIGPQMSSGATPSNINNILSYMQGVRDGEGSNANVGLYTNPGAFQQIYNAGYATYLWQTESTGQWNNQSLSTLASGWQIYNSTGFALSNGDHSIDGDFAFQASQHASGDFGQNPFQGTPASPYFNIGQTNSFTTFTQSSKQSLIAP